ncbi:hypothetical protein EYM_03350 [Ignicoccus islandicus DSM 13165]|uniref:Uncharacterized protein n=1 Tax=Ignicoccus islandicus DSM 13165 TaxID=940295 RepID=A0A0U3FSD6_9CREN|nr:hypothetical protein [Ignicoccus islandicus]ALU12400.1 hypothetical protein EYM_03350 [Ignicoccus islandicus DSM 13165]
MNAKTLLVVVSLLILALSENMAFGPSEVLLKEISFLNETIKPCGTWTTCSVAYASDVTVDIQSILAGALYPLDVNPLRSYLVLFDSVIDSNRDLISQIPILPPQQGRNEPEVFTFLPALLFLSFGYDYSQSKLVRLFEQWILASFSNIGVRFYSDEMRSYVYGSGIKYDLFPTLLSLTLSFKSAQRDGILNGTKYKSLLTKDFWSEYIQWIENTPSESPYYLRQLPRGLAILAAIPYEELRGICEKVVKTDFDNIYREYENGELISNEDTNYLAAIGIAIKWCNDKYNIFNSQKLEKVLQWIYLSIIHLQNGVLTYSPLVYGIYEILNGMNSTIRFVLDPHSSLKNFVEKRKRVLGNLSSSTSNVTTLKISNETLIISTITLVTTLEKEANVTSLFFTDTESQETTTVYEVPAPYLLFTMIPILRRRSSRS